MSQNNHELRTAESVSPGHPDKLCDQISDAILDEFLRQDPDARVAVETVGGHGKVFLTGEVSSSGHVDYESIVKRIAGDVEVEVHIAHQSPEIAAGVDTGGAGDQGIMVGYATSETAAKLPLEVVLSRDLNQYLYEKWPFDGKTQITVRGGGIVSIVASFQNAPHDELQEAVREWARHIEPIAGRNYFRKYQNCNPKLHINPAGDWYQGGFDADAGLTGRKLVVDNYGPRIAIGGGCFSGKDATKVDRSAAYMARKIALDYLERFKAKEVFVRLAYAIGYDQPLETTALVDGRNIAIEGYDLSPRGIIEYLDLTKPQFEQAARYGHFGHPEFSWEAPSRWSEGK